MTIPVENVVMLLGAAQGALIGSIIVQKHSALYANRFLALMMFAIAAVLMHMVLVDLDLYGSFGFLLPVILSLAVAVTPLHFLYAKFLMHRSERWHMRDAIHFIPFVVCLVAGLLIQSEFASNRNFFAEQRPINQYPVEFLLFNWVIIVQGLSYMAVVLVRIRSYEREIKNVFSDIENIRLRWLRNITLLAATAWSSFLIEHTLFSLGINVSNFMISSILIAMYLFTLGYLGMLKSEVLEVSLPESVPEVSQPDSVPVPESTTVEEAPVEEQEPEVAAGDASPKYEKSGLSEEAAKHYKKMILEVMEREKPYRTSDLTLPQLAELVRISPHNLSEVINSQLGKTFYDLINESRIGEVKQALADPARKNL
ncbi:MAG TPA: hypothetical protein VK470_00735, partial [Bacteroidota bacterium]|nr:hypothetical protein [Bacteroidota bacterium]